MGQQLRVLGIKPVGYLAPLLGSVERELLMVDFRGGGVCLALGEQVEADPTLLGYWPYGSWRPPRLNRTRRGA